jgi:dihydrofolate synthase/folylpolyglutamate synthase
MNEKYLNVLKRLYNTNKFKSRKVDLDLIQRACNLFNNPEKKIDYIHVTGTNGKGSVCKKLASTFIKSGMKTGLFISPHISTFRERIQINDNYIEKEYITEELERIYDVIDKNEVDLSYFEIVTLLCFNFFRDNKVDIGVMEVGLGGNLDATNVIDPLLSIITSIGMDHMGSLGHTQKEIAEKKAGIIKHNKPAIIGSDCNPIEVFFNRCRETNSPLYMCERKEFTDIFIDYDKENSDIVTKAVEVLKRHYPTRFDSITQEILNYGLQQKQPCRKEYVYEVLGKEILINHLSSKYDIKLNKKLKHILLDVGHNTHGIEKLIYNLRQDNPKSFIRVVCGFSANKDKNEILRIISSNSDLIYFVSAKHPRATIYSDLLEELETFLLNYNYDKSLFRDLDYEHRKRNKGDVKKVILQAFEDSNQSDNREEILLICGSFYLMNEARDTLGYIEEKDPLELNEMNVIKFSI